MQKYNSPNKLLRNLTGQAKFKKFFTPLETHDRGAFLTGFILCFVLLFIFLPFLSKIALADSSANFQIEIILGPQCYDGQDNDGDGKIDYPDDPGCSSQSDNDETDPAPEPSCGDGSCNGSETCSSCPADCGSCGGGGGGGGGGIIQPITSVTFSGRAYPKSTVTLLKDAQIAATTIAGSDAKFQINLTGVSAGNYIFSVYSEDSEGNRSSLLTFPVGVTYGAATNISGIFIAPTIAVDKSEVKRGDNIAIFGQSVPNSEVTISVNSDEEFFNKIKTDTSGAYLYNFDTSPLDMGQHFTKSKSAMNGEISSFSKMISFAVGTKNVAKAVQEFLKGDLNGDGRVNLVDFSIAAYWYKRTISAEFAVKEKERLNGDGKINLVDFSIMAFYWTG